MQAQFSVPLGAIDLSSRLAPTSIQPSLRFAAKSAIVTNPSGCWIYVNDALTFVPPFTSSMVVPFQYGTNVPRINLIAPSGQFNNPVGQPVTVIFDSNRLPASSGIAMPETVAQQSFALPLNGLYPDPNLPFFAQCGMVNNPSGNWWFFGDSQEFVPPYTSNKLIVCRSPDNTPPATLEAPAGQTNSPTGNAGSVTWYSSAQPPIGGTSLAPALSNTAIPVLIAQKNNGLSATLVLSSAAIPAGQWVILSAYVALQKAAATDYNFKVVADFNGTPFAQDFGNTANTLGITFQLTKPYPFTSTGVEVVNFTFTGTPTPFAFSDVNGIATFYYVRQTFA